MALPCAPRPSALLAGGARPSMGGDARSLKDGERRIRRGGLTTKGETTRERTERGEDRKGIACIFVVLLSLCSEG